MEGFFFTVFFFICEPIRSSFVFERKKSKRFDKLGMTGVLGGWIECYSMALLADFYSG